MLNYQTLVLGLLVLTAGCLSGGITSTPFDPGEAANQPNANQKVLLENSWNRSVDIQVQVVRESTNETVLNDTYTLDPSTERRVYTLSEADPKGVESFTIIATAQDTTDQVTIATSKCHGNAIAAIDEDGSMDLFYAIC